MGERGAESERGGENGAVSCLASLRCTGNLPSSGPESSEVAVRRSLANIRVLKMAPRPIMIVLSGDLLGDFVADFVGDFVGDRKQLLTRHLTNAATVWRRIISDAASTRTKYVTHRRNLSHLDGGTATHALPGLSDDVFSEVTAPAVILLRGCLNFTEGGLADEFIIQQGLAMLRSI